MIIFFLEMKKPSWQIDPRTALCAAVLPGSAPGVLILTANKGFGGDNENRHTQGM
jgi:hypothetical protein